MANGNEKKGFPSIQGFGLIWQPSSWDIIEGVLVMPTILDKLR